MLFLAYRSVGCAFPLRPTHQGTTLLFWLYRDLQMAPLPLEKSLVCTIRRPFCVDGTMTNFLIKLLGSSTIAAVCSSELAVNQGSRLPNGNSPPMHLGSSTSPAMIGITRATTRFFVGAFTPL